MNALTAKSAERMRRVSKLAGKALWQNKLSQIKIKGGLNEELHQNNLNSRIIHLACFY